MAKVTNAKTGESREVPDGSMIKDAAEEIGIVFGCRHGVCGTCQTEIVSGMENLEPRSQPEEALGVEGNDRLICQCKIKKGEVKLKQD